MKKTYQWIRGNRPVIRPPSTIINCLVTIESDWGAGIERVVCEAFFGTTPRDPTPAWFTQGHRRTPDDFNVIAWMEKPKPFQP